MHSRDSMTETERSPGRGNAATVSVVIPVLNEVRSIAAACSTCPAHPVVREVLVVDDGSTDGTAEVATDAGARVMTSSLPGQRRVDEGWHRGCHRRDSPFPGRRPSRDSSDDFVEKMVAPILDGAADLVKARFSRDAGRVTVLTARPLLGAFFPELAGFDQPLGGIVAVDVRCSRTFSWRMTTALMWVCSSTR